MAEGVRTGRSEIDGVGVFAERNFSRDDVILRIDDSYAVDEEHPIPTGEERHCDYLEHGMTVWMQLPERHINHSCDPNVYVRTSNGIRYVVALREIRDGDEITYDYRINGYGNVVWTCNCRAFRCRRTIHSDFFQLPLELQREYLPLLDDWFRKERAGEVADLLRRTK